MLRGLIGLAMVLVVLTAPAPAHAQSRGGAAAQGPSPEDIDKRRQEQALDTQYKDALKRAKQDSTPARIDPWANAREADVTKR